MKHDGVRVINLNHGDLTTHERFLVTKVYCVLRAVKFLGNPDDGGSIVRGLRISTMFTHHLRIVVVGREMLSGVSGMEDPWKSKTRSL